MTKEVKAMGGEAKALAAEMMAAFEAYRAANDERLSEIESKGAADTLLDEKLRKLDKRLDALSPGHSICDKAMRVVWRVWTRRRWQLEQMIRVAMLLRRSWIV